ncbi:MAG: hypothetical protein E7590_00055 [Ruminococcaceae bacterium]|nr:hypothetical protein [Oscillospiraceae bacterium]
MSNVALLRKMIRYAQQLIKTINEALDEPFFFLTGECGFFRLYGGDGDCDRLVMSGKIDIAGIAKLILRLEEVARYI